MTAFYTNVQVSSGKILYRGIDKDGRRIKKRFDYRPSLFVNSPEPTEYKTIHGEYVGRVEFNSIHDAKEFIKKYKDVASFPIYGNQRFEYSFIADRHKEEVIDYDSSKLIINNIDIEVASENGFSTVEAASEEITAITMRFEGRIVALACVDYTPAPGIEYIKCKNEVDLLEQFLEIWTTNYPDIVTGWNVKGFDIVYLVNRITRILGEDVAKTLSPWGYISSRTTKFMGRDNTTYALSGIAILDYLDLYRKFAASGNSQESYTLDNIGHVELGRKKVDYSKYGSLHRLYKENPQLFMEYNVEDTGIVDGLEAKLKLIELATVLAYNAKVNFEDVFAQVRLWTILIFNHLKSKKLVIPPNDEHKKSYAYEGAFVKEPTPGKYSWVASFDLTSLYPHLIMQYNISPDCFVEPKDQHADVRDLVSRVSLAKLLTQELDTSVLKKHGVTITPNQQVFTIGKKGFLSEMMEKMYDGRAMYKKMALAAKREKEATDDPVEKKELEKKVAKFNNLQLALKVSLNSAYGALGNEFFLFFDVRQAEAVTLAGQLSIRWIEQDLNAYMNKLLKTNGVDYIIAIDTDSVYVNFEKLVTEVFGTGYDTLKVVDFLAKISKDKIQPYIDKCYQKLADYTNAFAQKMIMKREAIADRCIWTAKKRYIMQVWDNEDVRYKQADIKITGLEAIKSSVPIASRLKIKEAIKIMLNGTNDECIAFIDKFREDFKKLEVQEIAAPSSMNGLEKYSDDNNVWGFKTPPHVKGALVFNNELKRRDLLKEYALIRNGEKVRTVLLKQPNPFQSPVLSFTNVIPSEFEIDKYIDYKAQFEKAFIAPMEIILNAIKWKSEKVNSLEDWFK